MLEFILTAFLLTPEAGPAHPADSTLFPDIRVRPFAGQAVMANVRGHLGERPLTLYLDVPDKPGPEVDGRVEASRNGIDFSPLPRSGQPQQAGGRWFIHGELPEVITCYRMRWQDASGVDHVSGVLLARRCRDGIVDAVCAAPFTAGESIGLELALRQRAFVRVVLTEQSTGRPHLLFRGMAEAGVGRWELGAGIEAHPGIWEMVVFVNGTERMRFEIEI
jgi:hypothetical protein